jgi:hypothetical protein
MNSEAGQANAGKHVRLSLWFRGLQRLRGRVRAG